MKCLLTVIDVRGHVNALKEIVSIAVDLTVVGCREMILKIGAGNEIEIIVPIAQEGAVTKEISGDQLVAIEAVCGRQIAVSASCADNPDCESRPWQGVLECTIRAEDHQGRPGKPGDKRCADTSDLIASCDKPAVAIGPQHVLHYHELVGFTAFTGPDAIEGKKEPVGTVPKLAAASVSQHQIAAPLRFEFGAMLKYEQRWFYEDLLISDVVSSLSLAPTETITLRIKKSQRNKITQNTLDSSEELNSVENRVIDKDVLNVARSSAKTENWKAASNANISIGSIFSIGGGVDYSKSISSKASHSIQQLDETSRKSAQSLKTMHKTEVSEESESEVQEASTRRITNPYRDRSLLLKFFDLEKHYCTETEFIGADPVAHIILDTIEMDRKFVLSSVDFLTTHLIDDNLAYQLTEALEGLSDDRLQLSKERAVEVACTALAYLFEVAGLFDLPESKTVIGYWNVTTTSKNAVNDPRASFDAENWEDSAFKKAANHQFSQLFSIVSYYRAIYEATIAGKGPPKQKPGIPVFLDPPNENFLVELAVGLQDAISTACSALEGEERKKFDQLLASRGRTEIFRRLSGFESFVRNVLKPLLIPLEEDKERWEMAKQAEIVLERVEAHLRDHMPTYLPKYLRYLAQDTDQNLIGTFADKLIDAWLIDAAQRDFVKAHFDTARLIVDRNVIVLPLREGATIDAIKQLDGFENVEFESIPAGIVGETAKVKVPFDGLHVEAVQGAPCAPLPSLEVDNLAGSKFNVIIADD